jgi:hypothetical protein
MSSEQLHYGEELKKQQRPVEGMDVFITKIPKADIFNSKKHKKVVKKLLSRRYHA